MVSFKFVLLWSTEVYYRTCTASYELQQSECILLLCLCTKYSPTVLSTALNYILLDRIRYRLISPPHVGTDISTSWFNQYFINHCKVQNVLHIFLVDLLIILPWVFFFVSQCPCTNLQFTHCYFHMHACQRNSCNQRFSGLRQNVGESGYAISSCHGQLALDNRPWCWPSVNISTEYLALPNHDSMNNPSVQPVYAHIYEKIQHILPLCLVKATHCLLLHTIRYRYTPHQDQNKKKLHVKEAWQTSIDLMVAACL